jgi:hypothetical protein
MIVEKRTFPSAAFNFAHVERALLPAAFDVVLDLNLARVGTDAFVRPPLTLILILILILLLTLIGKGTASAVPQSRVLRGRGFKPRR